MSTAQPPQNLFQAGSMVDEENPVNKSTSKSLLTGQGIEDFQDDTNVQSVKKSSIVQSEETQEGPKGAVPAEIDEEQSNDQQALLKEEEEEEEEMESALSEDIYSLIYTSPVKSSAFWFAIGIFVVQATMLILIMINLYDMTNDPPRTSDGSENRIQMPPGVSNEVVVAQFMGVLLIIIFAIATGDMLTGLSFLFNGFNEEVLTEYPAAIKIKWLMAGVFQSFVGAIMIFDLFILLMTSTEVLGLCLNFAALHFIQDIDNVSFIVGQMGYFGRHTQKMCNEIGNVKIPKSISTATWYMRRITIFVLSFVLYYWFFSLSAWQASGDYRCSTLYVQFGDSYFPELAYYSGVYTSGSVFLGGGTNSRAVFVDDSETIALVYSRGEKAWVFRYNNETNNEYLIKSSETATFDVTTIAGSQWYANTPLGVLDMDWISVQCNDCIKDDCAGTCEDNVCVCEEGFFGPKCQDLIPARDACLFFGVDHTSLDSLSNVPGAFFFNQVEYTPSVANLTFFDRHVYIPYDFNETNGGNDNQVVSVFIMFAGRRWIIFGGATGDNINTTTEEFTETLLDYLENDPPASQFIKFVTSFGDGEFVPLYFSSPSDHGTPTDSADIAGFTWVHATPISEEDTQAFSVVGYGPDDSKPVGNLQFLCSDCRTSGCLNDGICNNQTGYCVCLPFYEGFKCEYAYACQDIGCFNGGRCDEVSGICTACFEGAYGNLCQYPLDDEVMEEDLYYCTTPHPWYGPCKNEQRCNALERTCECQEPYYSGEFCEITNNLQNCTQYSNITGLCEKFEPIS